jgi:hypothetical protein
MRRIKLKIALFISFLILLFTLQVGVAANQYSVKVGAQFRWNATKYMYTYGIGGFTYNYYLEFNFTDWGDISGLDYLNGIVNDNGTVYDSEISHEYYYARTPALDPWVTEILDTSGGYPVYIYLVCETEIEQATKPSLQALAANSWLAFGEPSTNNFTLTGTFVDGEDSATYTGNIEFNSDKVLKYVYDELVMKTSGITQTIERYIWTLTYTPGTGTNGEPDETIPGFSLYMVVTALAIGIILIIRKNTYLKSK